MQGRNVRHKKSLLSALARTVCLLAAVPACPTLLEANDPEPGPRLAILEVLELPLEVASASDVRWLSEGELLLGRSGQGVYSWRIGEDRAELRATLAGTSLLPSDGPADYSRVGGFSEGSLAFADIVFGLYRSDEAGVDRTLPLELVADIDRHEASTVAIGLVRQKGGGWGEYGAWLVQDDHQPRGILPTQDGGQGMSWCFEAELPAVRFVSPDRILVIPGAEPGIFVFSREGFLVGSVEASVFEADDGCVIEPAQRHLLADDAYRVAWLSRRRVIDEVVADETGNVFLFVRHVPDPLPEPLAPVSGTGPGIIVGGASGESTVVQGEAALEILRSIAAAPPASEESEAEQEHAGTGAQSSARIPGQEVVLDPEVAAALLAAVAAPDPSPSGPGSPSARVCWDLFHTRLDDLGRVTVEKCAVETDKADVRLRADLKGGRLVILLRTDVMTAAAEGHVRPSQAFRARLQAPRPTNELP